MNEAEVIRFLFEKGIIDRYIHRIEDWETGTIVFQNACDPEYSYQTFGECVYEEDIQIDPQELLNALVGMKKKEV